MNEHLQLPCGSQKKPFGPLLQVMIGGWIKVTRVVLNAYFRTQKSARVE